MSVNCLPIPIGVFQLGSMPTTGMDFNMLAFVIDLSVNVAHGIN
ncbi:MAG: hypothetical protein WCA79_13340 [Anaerolineales bacterium]